METQIKWMESLDKAIKEAQKEKKAIFLDFFNPG